jgi:hypothetical protein
MTTLRRIFSLTFLGLVLTVPLEYGDANAQQNPETVTSEFLEVQFQKLKLHRLVSAATSDDYTQAGDLRLSPLTLIEENMARNLDSHWAWPEYTLEMIDSYSPFLFRTKKSQDLEEVKIHLEVNSKGRLSGFEVIGQVDNGLKERLDHMIRKLPDCKPVPGYSSYRPERFELTIRK